MRKTILASAVIGALSVPAISVAADEASPHTLTANAGIYSQYIFRGLSQTNEEPAFQGGLDYAHASGVYVGAWGSNISWLKENFTTASGVVGGQYDGGGSLELDVYGGYKGAIGDTGLTYDVGALYYWYPGDVTSGCMIGTDSCPDADTLEVYAGLGWKWFSVKYSHSVGDTFGWPGADNSYYLDLSASVPLGETGITLGAHYGLQRYEGDIPGSSVSYDDVLSYDDWRLSVAYDLSKVSATFTGMEVGGMVTGTNDAHVCGYGKYSQSSSLAGTACSGVFPKNVADDQVAVWLKKTF